MLNITCHGGKCCGIKHISGFPLYPTQTQQDALEAVTGDNTDEEIFFDDQDSCGHDVNTAMMFFQDAAPQESLWDRFDRLIQYLYELRPGGIVECVLAKEESEWDQIALHGPKLLERGFRVVSEVENSNSGNLIRVYHLTMEK